MTLSAERTTRDSRGRPGAARLVGLGFSCQAVASLVVWTLVNDRSSGASWSNTDFGQWVRWSLVCAAVITLAGTVGSRCRGAAFGLAGGCLLAVLLGWAVFYGYAVIHSA